MRPKNDLPTFFCVLLLATCLCFFGCKSEPKSSTLPISTIAKDSVPPIKDTIPVVIAPVYDYDTSQWTEIRLLDSTILIDLKYATSDNFVEEQLYDCPRCFLRPAAAKALVARHQHFQKQGLGIKVYDCYRPRPIQQKLWDKVPNASYVTPPKKGSMHNRGLAVDLTLVDQHGKPLEMGTAYDFFGKRAHHTFTDLPQTVLDNRKLLKETLFKFNFQSIRTEWWHYSYTIGKYALSDMLWDCPDTEQN